MRYQKQTTVVSSPLIEHNSSWMLPAPETNTHLTSHLFSFFEHIHSADLHLPKVTRAWFLKRIKADSMTALEGHSGHFKSHQSYIGQLHDDDLATTRQAVRCHHQKNMFLFACASARFWVFGGRWHSVSRGCVLLANAMIHGFRVAVLLFWFLRHDDRTRKRFQIEGYFHRHVIVPSLSKLYKMSSSCGRHIATTLPPHRRHIAAAWPPQVLWQLWRRGGGNVAATWRQCGGNVAATWRQCGGNAAAMRRRCGGDVAAMWRQCGGDVAAMWRRCGGDVAAMWRRCGCDVSAMWWRCGGNVAAMWWRCGGNVATMRRRCVDKVATT